MISTRRLWDWGFAAILFIAAGSKSLAPQDTIRLFEWLGLSLIGAWIALCLLVLIEIGTAGLLVHRGNAASRALGLSLLAIFTVFLLYLMTQPGAPACGCGKVFNWFSSSDARETARAGVWRNLTFMLAFACAAAWDSLPRASRVATNLK